MARFNKEFYKKELIKIYGDSKTTRKMMMIIDLNMSQKDRRTWNEFISMFGFVY